MTWYTEITKNLSKIPDALAHFEAEYESARRECGLKGNLEKHASSMPGIVEHRWNQLQELEAVLEHLNIQLRRVKTKHYKKYLENYARALSSRDAEKYAEGEDEVCDMEALVNEWALMRNRWLGILKGLDQKQWQITNVTKLRVAGMEDADIR